MRFLVLLSWVVAFGGCGREPLVDGDEATGGHSEELAEQCRSGCPQIRECAPEAYAQLYDADDDCRSQCTDRFADCEEEAFVYMDCVVALECGEVEVLLTEGPDAVGCGESFDATLAACGS